MGPIGAMEMAVIFIVALVLFGPKKLPELGKTVGKALTEFRRARDELKTTFDREMQTIERETAPVREDLQKQLDEVNASTQDYNYYDSHGYGNDAYHDSYESYNNYGSDSSTPAPAATSQIAETVSASATEGADNQATATIEGTVPANSPLGEVDEPKPKGPQAVA
jgi:sec-independent protein translocase protein TatA